MVRRMMWVMAAICAAGAGWIVWGPKRVKPVQQLARELEAGWADHHTRA